MEKAELKKLLRDFNVKGYADENSKYLDNGKNGKILKLTLRNFTYEDEFYGGEPYSGNETIWEKEKDIFRCVYFGKVIKGVNFGDIYSFLRKALSLGPSGNCVHRGPIEFIEGNLKYTNECVGDIFEFQQTEKIFLDGKGVYTAWFIGGIINVQKE